MGGIVAGAILILSIISPVPKLQDEAISAPQNTSLQKKNIEATKPSIDQLIEQDKTYVVETGDSIDSIALEFYGSSKYWTILWNDNDFIENPKSIMPGWKLKIRGEAPKSSEELRPELAKIYEELTSTPSPTPTPTISQEQVTISVSSATTSSFEETYKQAGNRFGIPWEILYGLHHMETRGRDGAISSGYGTGAQGPLQFMPSTWAAYGIDGNADGTVDINNAIDAIFGAANYLSKHGTIEQGLKAYGGNSDLVYSYARSRGWNP